jgi:hypothetical protein
MFSIYLYMFCNVNTYVSMYKYVQVPIFAYMDDDNSNKM